MKKLDNNIIKYRKLFTANVDHNNRIIEVKGLASNGEVILVKQEEIHLGNAYSTV